ncbi:MAG: SRPBCC family protein [Candidatus Rokubacteria bacterium]|nr:SRPBCC family protein [Candidatus Rokubacteria bacterium]
MADHILESRIWLPRGREEVFPFFADPRNLAEVTPRRLGFRLLSAAPMPLEAGAVFDCRIRFLGIPLRWRTFIREYDPPFRFVDVQVRGPYARWEHRHLFRAENAGTWVEDRITYRLPLGPLGRLVHALVVRRQLDAIFAYRRLRLAQLFPHGNG